MSSLFCQIDEFSKSSMYQEDYATETLWVSFYNQNCCDYAFLELRA